MSISTKNFKTREEELLALLMYIGGPVNVRAFIAYARAVVVDSPDRPDVATALLSTEMLANASFTADSNTMEWVADARFDPSRHDATFINAFRDAMKSAERAPVSWLRPGLTVDEIVEHDIFKVLSVVGRMMALHQYFGASAPRRVAEFFDQQETNDREWEMLGDYRFDIDNGRFSPVWFLREIGNCAGNLQQRTKKDVAAEISELGAKMEELARELRTAK